MTKSKARRRWLPVTAALLLAAVAVEAHAQWTWTPQTGRWINLKRLPKETPELQVEYARSLYLDGDLKKALRETDKFDRFYGDNDAWADDNQFLRGEIEAAQGDYLKAAREFQQVIVNYPDSPLYDEVIARQYDIGDMLYAKGQRNVEEKGWWNIFRKRPLRRAIEVYGMVLENQPFTNEAAEAQYKVGLCHFALDQYIEAAYEYRRVVDDYARSEWVDEASYGLAQCYYEGSHPPEYDQEPSYLAIDAVEAFKARFPNDPRVDELEGVAEEMRNRIAEQRLLTAKFYEKRRRFEAARIYYEVVVDQFPGTPAAEEALAVLRSDAPVTEPDVDVPVVEEAAEPVS